MADPIPPWPGGLVTLPTGDVFVRTAPAPDGAEAAVFVHGLGGSALNWTDLMDLLSRPGTDPGTGEPVGPVLAGEALDLPGFGHSPVPADGDYALSARAAAVIALIDQQGRWPVHLFGNSMGGAIATRVAARRPDLVRTLTLISPALPDLRPRVLPLRVAALGVPGLGRWVLTRLDGVTAEQRTARTLREVFADASLIHPNRVREEVEELTRRDGLGYQNEVMLSSARALVAEYTRVGPASLWRDAARITAPTLVIHGSHDRLVNPATAARAARVFRNAHVVLLPRTGHVAMLEHPERVARIVRQFLADADDARSAHPEATGRRELDSTEPDSAELDSAELDSAELDSAAS
jgi:pimeloyl-ACP methyl ester carboxylesterase